MTGLERRSLAALVPAEETLVYGLPLLYVQAVVLGAYLLATGADGGLGFYLYPFVYLNVGAWALWRTTPAPVGGRRRRVALAVAAVYALLLGYAGGLVGPGNAVYGTDLSAGLRVATTLPPGYGPALLYDGAYLRLSLLPYRVVGYGALVYLVYATALEASEAVLGGVLGLLSCVSCTWPVIAAVLTGVLGVTGGTAAAFAPSRELSVLVYLVTVALLVGRPFAGAVGR
jgi:hypothetical protein